MHASTKVSSHRLISHSIRSVMNFYLLFGIIRSNQFGAVQESCHVILSFLIIFVLLSGQGVGISKEMLEESQAVENDEHIEKKRNVW